MWTILDPVDKHQKNKKYTKNKKYSESLGWDPPLPESLGICSFLDFLFYIIFFESFWPPSFQESANITLSATSPNDHAYGSAVYVVKSRPIANDNLLKNCTPRGCRSER